jgi:ferredoxin-NADP reductase
MSQNTGTLNLRVARIESVTPEIKRFTLVSPTGEHLPAFSGGSHVVVLIANDRNTLRNPYSLLSSPYDTSSYQIAVRRVQSGRGGSVALHDSVNEGDLIEVTPPVNLFPLIKQAPASVHRWRRRHHPGDFATGGVAPEQGAVRAALRGARRRTCATWQRAAGDLRRQGSPVSQGHRSAHGHRPGPGRSPARQSRVRLRPGQHDRCHPGLRPRIGLDRQPRALRTFPRAKQRRRSLQFHLGRSGATIEVSPDQTMLEAVEAAGYSMPYLCRGGACGHCETEVLELDGELLHTDDWLSDEDKTSGKKIMPCVSRAKCNRLVIDL